MGRVSEDPSYASRVQPGPPSIVQYGPPSIVQPGSPSIVQPGPPSSQKIRIITIPLTVCIYLHHNVDALSLIQFHVSASP